MFVSRLLRKFGSRHSALDALRARMFDGTDRYRTRETCGPFTITINDGPNFYVCYKDIFLGGIYSFSPATDRPRIIDCGANIGVSILYFKCHYPAARVLGFEIDPKILPLLRQTLAENGLDDVEIVEAALADKPDHRSFFIDGKYGSTLFADSATHEGHAWPVICAPTVPLADYLNEPIDLLKMNIEGAEWPVLEAAESKIRQVREIIIEYHHLPGLPRTLHSILALLHRNGFEYLINDLDASINPGTKPPFRLEPDSRYFLLIYGHRIS
jgi:FkbM family methyltransferase